MEFYGTFLVIKNGRFEIAWFYMELGAGILVFFFDIDVCVLPKELPMLFITYQNVIQNLF